MLRSGLWEAFSKEPRPELDGLPPVEEVAGRQRKKEERGRGVRHSVGMLKGSEKGRVKLSHQAHRQDQSQQGNRSSKILLKQSGQQMSMVWVWRAVC